MRYDLRSLEGSLSRCKVTVIDFETTGIDTRTDSITGLGVYFPETDEVYYINVGHHVHDATIPRHDEMALARILAPFLDDPRRHALAHNASYELRLLFRLGLAVNCRVSDSMTWVHRADENLHEDKTKHRYTKVTYGLKELTVALRGIRPPNIAETTGGQNMIATSPRAAAEYCAYDVLNTWELYQWAVKCIGKGSDLYRLIEEIDDRNNVPLARMMAQGIGIDANEAGRQRDEYERAIQRCREAIWNSLKINWPLGTPAEIDRVLQHIGVRDYPGSLEHEALLELFHDATADQRRVLALMLSMRQMDARIDTFLQPARERVRYTEGRLYPSRFTSTLVTTRFSSQPNLQNLPGKADKDSSEDAEWRELLPDGCGETFKTRNIFIAKRGHVLIQFDLSAAEPRYMALLFQRALEDRGTEFQHKRAQRQAERRGRYPLLLKRMYETRLEQGHDLEQIVWPEYTEDPLHAVFREGRDPYDALLIAIDEEGHTQAKERGEEADWLEDNRWRAKRAFLALAYGSQAESLANGLKWSIERTQQALEALNQTYATLAPLQQLTELQVIHLGEVTSLWGRPRRINGYYQLTRPTPILICFHRAKPHFRRYLARIIPLGMYRQGVQAFVRECWVDLGDGRKELVLSGDPTTGELIHADKCDPFVRAEHFNTIPYRNIPFNQTEWVQEANGLRRYLPRQSAAFRQAFNAMCQATGADHLRWLMNALQVEVLDHHPAWKLILTMHDSVIFEVPNRDVAAFANLVKPIVACRPPWSDIDFKVKGEFGKRFGKLKPL